MSCRRLSAIVMIIALQSVPAISQTAPGISAPNNRGIVTENQSGGTNIIYRTPRRLRLTEEIGSELLKTIPEEKPVIVEAVGSNADAQVGIQMAAFLRAHGYNVDLQRIGMIAPPPDHSLTWIPAISTLIVDPGAH